MHYTYHIIDLKYVLMKNWLLLMPFHHLLQQLEQVFEIKNNSCYLAYILTERVLSSSKENRTYLYQKHNLLILLFLRWCLFRLSIFVKENKMYKYFSLMEILINGTS